MRKIIELGQPEWKEGILELHSERPDVSMQHLKPGGQMIVDSDACAFIYLAEDDGDEDYTYLYLPVPVWKEIRTAAFEHKKVVAVSKDGKLELTGLDEELHFLLDNIRGNSNYGKKMLDQVEAVFALE
ncbi:hypothetical protein [Heyndrickxia faecalis]|uniref:UPF0738 family protein n=1 Tax=Heyndrickxia faecalis TaxID=2824910 RepID=UPI003597ECE5